MLHMHNRKRRRKLFGETVQRNRQVRFVISLFFMDLFVDFRTHRLATTFCCWWFILFLLFCSIQHFHRGKRRGKRNRERSIRLYSLHRKWHVFVQRTDVDKSEDARTECKMSVRGMPISMQFSLFSNMNTKLDEIINMSPSGSPRQNGSIVEYPHHYSARRSEKRKKR